MNFKIRDPPNTVFQHTQTLSYDSDCIYMVAHPRHMADGTFYCSASPRAASTGDQETRDTFELNLVASLDSLPVVH